MASLEVPDDLVFPARIVESEDLGLWILLYRDEVAHSFLLRWEYVLAVEMLVGPARPFGLSGGKDLG